MILRPIFKFLEQSYVKGMLNSGFTRVATLHEFRDASKYGGDIVDQLEGRFLINDFSCKETEYITAKTIGGGFTITHESSEY